MTLVQIMLPLYDNRGHAQPRERFTETLRELTDTFGGATAFTRAPAEGLWEDPDGHVQKDDVVVVEVMIETVDGSWWRHYGAMLEARFEQETILMRALPCLEL